MAGMNDEKMVPSEPMEPVKVAIIGTGDGGTPMVSGTTAITPSPTQPNLVVTIVTPIAAILIRFVNNYLTMVVGLVSAGMVTDVLPVSDFTQLVILSAKLSVAGASIALAKDVITIFGRLENKFPLLTGSV